MNVKRVVTAVLLVFVAVSIVALIIREAPLTSPSSGTETIGSAKTGAEGDRQAPDAGRWEDDRVVVYYFHGNVRCPTCLTLEAYSKEAVETHFAEELKSGRVVWQVVNFDETWNEHFTRQYDLAFQSLVIVKVRDGKEAEFKNLDKIWELVDDKEAYFNFVTREARSYLEGM